MPEEMLPKDISPVSPIHTLETDVNNVIKEDKVDIVSYVSSEKKESTSVKSLFKSFSIILLSILIIVGAGLGIVNIAKQRSDQVPIVEDNDLVEKNNELIVYNSIRDVSFSPEDFNNIDILKDKIKTQTVAEGPDITFFKSTTPLKLLLSSISPNIPPDYLRSLTDENFWGGFNEGNFLILKFDSYEKAYSGQLEWENSMSNSLFPILLISSPDGVAKFEDRIISNRDIRVALDQNGRTLFVYGFFRKEGIIFARSEEVFDKVYGILLRENL